MTTIDDTVTERDRRAAMDALKMIRRKALKATLDKQIDELEPRAVAHLAEEACRHAAPVAGLWRYTGGDSVLITGALRWLVSVPISEDSLPRNRFRGRLGPEPVRRDSTRPSARNAK